MVESWGRAHKVDHVEVDYLPNYGADGMYAKLASSAEHELLVHGNGRSYGDVALNANRRLLMTPHHNRLLAADWSSGVVRASSGLLLSELLTICVPRGWFPAVTPGTKYVTLGGAVANDVHGKNHHVAGSFGTHVRALKLVRSDKGSIVCTPETNPDLFGLTIGGLGLTGFIDWVEIQLQPIKSSDLFVENLACSNLEQFFALSKESADWPYTLMWVDCFAQGDELGRGVFSRAKFETTGELRPHFDRGLTMPITTPAWLLNKFSISAFNQLYRRRPSARYRGRQHYDPFFYPLDGIRRWNRLYGKKGFYQHQCIIPPPNAQAGIRTLLEEINRSNQGSFLAVLKVHGPETSPGVMSFCQEGTSLALDFANKGKKTTALLQRLDAIVEQCNGRLYPAKDGCMSPELFQASYPQWRDLEKARDPMISSSFWRRVTQE